MAPTPVFFFFLYGLLKLYCYYFLQYYIGFAIHQHESAMGVHVFPIQNPPPSLYHPSGSSQCTSPKHPVSCIEPGLAIRFTYDIINVSHLPNHPTLALPHSSILAWRIPWTEDPGGLQSIGSQRVGHD